MLLRPDLFFPLLMMAAEPPGDTSGGSSTSGAEGAPEPNEGLDWRSRYEALEADRRKDQQRLAELEDWKSKAEQSAAGDDVKAQLALRDRRIAELEGVVKQSAADERQREFMAAATRGAPEANRTVLELAVRGALAKTPELGEGDPEVAAAKLRRSLETQGLGELFTTASAPSSSESTKRTPPTTKPAGTGKRDWSTVKSLEGIPASEYGDIPDTHWRRLTGQ